MTGKQRSGLSSFLRDELAVTPAAPEPGTTRPAKSGSARVPKSGTSKPTDSVSTEVAPKPRYLQLTRKEVRFPDDQLEALDRLARRLQRARRGAGGERITENTLVRVAVAALLARADALSGATAAELLAVLLAAR